VIFLVDAASKLSEALKLHPDVLDYIVSLNPNDFTRLYHPLMRKLMPPRITLGRVAIMTHTPVFTLLRDIHDIAQHPLTESDCALLAHRLGDVTPDLPANPEAPPAWMQHPVLEVVDLLEHDARLDADPMPPISRALKRVAPGGLVLVKHMWEPQPLYDIWRKVGVEYYAVQRGLDEWWIYLRQAPLPTPAPR
jgi:hypothetical protein